jgi:hypothetical protein
MKNSALSFIILMLLFLTTGFSADYITSYNCTSEFVLTESVYTNGTLYSSKDIPCESGCYSGACAALTQQIEYRKIALVTIALIIGAFAFMLRQSESPTLKIAFTGLILLLILVGLLVAIMPSGATADSHINSTSAVILTMFWILGVLVVTGTIMLLILSAINWVKGRRERSTDDDDYQNDEDE